MLDSFFTEIKVHSQEFYKRNRWRAVGIFLVGSLARGEFTASDKLADVDVLLITRFYDIWLKSKFREYLEKQITVIDFDVGVYPLSRIITEKSLFVYDLKHHGKVLAGRDVRSSIQEISVDDLYPFEGFRLLFNRCADLVKAVKDYSSARVVLQPESFTVAASRIQRSYVDSYLIFRKKYHPNFICRVKIFSSFDRKIPKIENFEDARKALLDGMNEGLKLTGINSYEKLLNSMRREFRYPLSFRIYTALVIKNHYALLANPIFDAYGYLLKFLMNKWDDKNWINFKNKILEKMNAPQPIL